MIFIFLNTKKEREENHSLLMKGTPLNVFSRCTEGKCGYLRPSGNLHQQEITGNIFHEG